MGGKGLRREKGEREAFRDAQRQRQREGGEGCTYTVYN
jgi:hypothetical protein